MITGCIDIAIFALTIDRQVQGEECDLLRTYPLSIYVMALKTVCDNALSAPPVNHVAYPLRRSACSIVTGPNSVFRCCMLLTLGPHPPFFPLADRPTKNRAL